MDTKQRLHGLLQALVDISDNYWDLIPICPKEVLNDAGSPDMPLFSLTKLIS